MAVSSPALPPMGAVLGAAFDRALTIVVGSWRLFLIVAVLALLGGFVNIAISAIILGTFLTYFYFASLANAIRLDIPGYAMTGAVVARLILFGIVYGLAVDIGLILFIVPGIYVATKWSLAPIIIAKEDASLGDALAKSWTLTEFCFWQTLGFQILAGLGVFAVTIVGGLIGELVATAVFWSVFHTATAGGPSGTMPTGWGGALGFGVAVSLVIYLYAIAYTYQARDVALLKWVNGIQTMIGR